jgi:hypothetical protein
MLHFMSLLFWTLISAFLSTCTSVVRKCCILENSRHFPVSNLIRLFITIISITQIKIVMSLTGWGKYTLAIQWVGWCYWQGIMNLKLVSPCSLMLSQNLAYVLNIRSDIKMCDCTHTHTVFSTQTHFYSYTYVHSLIIYTIVTGGSMEKFVLNM